MKIKEIKLDSFDNKFYFQLNDLLFRYLGSNL